MKSVGSYTMQQQYTIYKSILTVYLQEYLRYLKKLSVLDPVMDKYKGIAVSAEQAEGVLLFPEFQLSQNACERIATYTKRLVELEKNASGFLPFSYLCETFSLRDGHEMVVMAAFLAELFPELSRVYGYLNDNVQEKHLTLYTAGKLFLNHRTDQMLEAQKTYLPQLFDLSPEKMGDFDVALKLSRRVRDFLLRLELRDTLPGTSVFWGTDPLEPMVGREKELAMVEQAHRKNHAAIFEIVGEPQSGRKFFLRHCVRSCARNLIFVDLAQWDGGMCNSLKRELRLQKAYCCFLHPEVLEPAALEQLFREIHAVSELLFLCTEEKLPLEQTECTVLSLTELSFSENLQIWESLDSTGQYKQIAEQLTETYRFLPGQISRIWRESCGRIELLGEEESFSQLLEQVCLERSEGILKGKATRIQSRFTFDDLILPEEEKKQIREGMDHIRYRHKVYDAWHFSQQMPYGRGLSMLFEGPPGTGKTMAASIVGNELGLPVFKIDLSKMQSKYIGETEKNLGAVFDIAQKNNAILFFDETDAIFSKRSEVRESHDKYANAEISFLLQRMEEYDGILILTTNFKQNIDAAFMRRISYVIRFPFPEKAQRLQLWNTIFPKEAELEEGIDFQFLAETFELSGAMIKNAAVSAAFLAAAQSRKIGMREILLAVKKQFAKFGKTLSPQHFGPYAVLLEETR